MTVERSQSGQGGQGQVVLLTAWHLSRMRDMPRSFWRVRRLDRATRDAPGVLWAHRWISRRSLALVTRWQDVEAAERWLASAAFTACDAPVRALPGASARVERYRDLSDTLTL